MKKISLRKIKIYTLLFCMMLFQSSPLFYVYSQGFDIIRYTSIVEYIGKILDAVILAFFPVLVLMFVYTGFRFIMAQGKPDQLAHARSAALWTFVGTAVVLGAKTILSIVDTTVQSIFN
jgi:hypothetical protein